MENGGEAQVRAPAFFPHRFLLFDFPPAMRKPNLADRGERLGEACGAVQPVKVILPPPSAFFHARGAEQEGHNPR